MMGPDWLTDDAARAMAAHAEADYPREACGLIVRCPEGVQYLPRRNSAANPEADFRIPPQGYVGAARRGEILAVAHSHPRGPAWPSEADMAGQLASGLPWCIVPVRKPSAECPATADAAVWWGPGVPIAPLLEREFVPGIADCYALGRDWYRIERGVTLPDFARPDQWWLHGRDLLTEHLAEAGFVRTDEPAQVGDGVIMQIRCPVPNHVGVYVGGGLMLHHLTDRLSRIEPLYRWRSHVVCRVRRAS